VAVLTKEAVNLYTVARKRLGCLFVVSSEDYVLELLLVFSVYSHAVGQF
jgi:hypothetical protein